MRTEQTIAHVGNVGSEGDTAMTFDESSIAHLMSVLTDLYSDPAMAVIREYSVNARDSHVEAGMADVPIQISRPSTFNPTFVVRDNGVGLSLAEIQQNLSKYGWSSKRDTDEQTGMLGLGSKSGLTFSKQFTMTAVKNGVRCVVLVTRSPEGGGVLKVVDTASTTEPNGVEVAIPVESPTYFNEKIETFFQYWEPGTVLIDGELHDFIGDRPRSYWLDHDHGVLAVRRELPHGGRDYDPSVIVQGGVPYPVKLGLAVRGEHDFRFVVFADIGTVNFTPNREELQRNKRTDEAIHTIEQFLKSGVQPFIQRLIANAPSRAEALRLAIDLMPLVGGRTPRYKGSPIPTGYFTGDHGLSPNARLFRIKPPASWSSERDVATQLNIYNGFHPKSIALEIHGFTRKSSISAHEKEQIRGWVKENLDLNGLGEWVLLTSTPVAEEWWGVRRVTFAEVTSFDIGVPAPKPKKSAQPYRRVLDEHGNLVTRRPEEFNPLCWIRVTDLAKDDYRRKRLVNQLAAIVGRESSPNGVLAVVYKKDAARFAKDYPDVPHLYDWIALPSVRSRVLRAQAELRTFANERQLGVPLVGWDKIAGLRRTGVATLDPILNELFGVIRLRKFHQEEAGLIIKSYNDFLQNHWSDASWPNGANLRELRLDDPRDKGVAGAPRRITNLRRKLYERYPLLVEALRGGRDDGTYRHLMDYVNATYLAGNVLPLVHADY